MLELLNDPENIKAMDTSDMLGIQEAFPAQCRDAFTLAGQAELGDPGDVGSIIILGMGASGIGGDIVKALYERLLDVPIAVVKGYELPAFVNSKSLVFAISYSGETEETLAAVEAAGARQARVVAVTSGGRLKTIAGEKGYPVVPAPPGLQPRAALGHLSVPMIVALERFGLVSGASAGIEETLEILEMMSKDMRASAPVSSNIAKQLACHFYEKMPVIYGSDGPPGVAALRWKCQFNENSKVPAYWNQFPDLNHNEIVGWQELRAVSEKFCLITLRSAGEHDRIRKRIEVTLPLIENFLGESLQVWAEGESEIARIFSLIYLGDITSVYLAVLNGVDPTPVDRIMSLKKALKEDS